MHLAPSPSGLCRERRALLCSRPHSTPCLYVTHRRRPWRLAAAGPAGDQPPPSFDGPGSQGSNGSGLAGLELPADLNPYAEIVRGKRFVCTECGKCCSGAGEVWVTLEECSGMAQHLGLGLDRFLDEYTKTYAKRPGWRLLKRAKGSQDCIFLVGGTKCGIHAARPLQCATYPWWPELMHPTAWVAERTTVCEGINHEDAREVDPEEGGEMLRLATEQLAALQAASAAGRAGKEGDGA